jgi:hypothetical protein
MPRASPHGAAAAEQAAPRSELVEAASCPGEAAADSAPARLAASRAR